MKTIIARFTELKENVAGTAESEFDDLDYNKVDTALKSVGVSLKDTNGQFRDLDDVFLDLANKWDTLDRNTQRYIATTAAGSRQQSRFLAMMSDYDRTISLIDTAYDSAGKSSEQFAKYQDTVEYKLNQLKNSWEQLRISFFDSDVYKGALDTLNKFMNVLTNMDTKQFIGVGLVGLTLGKAVVTNFIKGIQDSSRNLQTAWRTTLEKALDTKGKSLFNNSIKNFWEDFKKQKPDEKKYVDNMNQILGNKVLNAPTLETNIEAQKTRELQNQLSIFNQLEIKRKSILQCAQQELNAGRGISQSTREQSNQAVQLSNEKLNYLNQLARELGYEKEITAENAQQLMQEMQQGAAKATSSALRNTVKNAGTSALSAGLTSALMTALSGADFSTVIKTTAISAITAALPNIISAIAPMLIQILTGPAGIIALAATALIGGAIFITKKITAANKAVKEAELNRLKAVKEANEELAKQQEQYLKELKSSENEKDTLENNLEKYQKLQNKGFLTVEETEEMQTIASSLNEQYPDIISQYDENTGELKLNTAALEELKTTLENTIQINKERIAMSSNQQILNAAQGIEKTDKAIQDFQKSFINIQSSWGYSTMTNNKPNFPVYAGYEISQDTNTQSGQQLVAELSNFLKQVNEEYAIQAGITKDLYNSITEGSWEQLYDALDKSTLSLGQLTNAAVQAAQYQKEDYQKEIEESERNRIKNALVTMENFDISDEMAEIFSYVSTDSAEELRELSKNYANKYFKSLEDSGVNRFNYLENVRDWKISDIAKSSNDIEKIQESLNLLGYGEKADEELNIKKISDLFEEDTSNLVEFSKLSNQMQQTFLNMGHTEADWEKNRKNAEKMKDFLDEMMSYGVLAQDNVISEVLTPQVWQENQQAILDYENAVNNFSNKTFEEYSNELENAKKDFSTPELTNAIDEYYEKTDNSILSIWEKANQELEGLGIDTTELGYNASTGLLEELKEINLSKQQRTGLGQSLSSILGQYDDEVQSALTSIDLTSSYADLLTNSKQYIDALNKAGLSSEEASKVFYEYISKAREYIYSSISSLEGITVLREGINTNLSALPEQYSSLLAAQKEFQENSRLSSETYYKLLEDGFGDYVKVTSDGYQLLSEDAATAYNDMALSQYRVFQAAISDQEKTLNALNTKDQLTIQVKDKNGNYNIEKKSLSEAAEYFKQNQKEFEKYDGQYKSLIQDFINDDETIWSNYVENKAYILDEMREQEDEIYIQALQTMIDNYEQAEDQISDLNDELEDLNETLADNKKAVDDAYKTWQEAIHGTKDYQSSLDGLLNYERRIESFNRELEKTNEALSDVTDVENAKDLLNQTASLYEGKLATLKAESKVVNQSLENIDKEILANYSDFVSFDEFNNMQVDISKLESADMSDILKDEGFTKLLEKRNEMYDKASELDNDYLETVKEWEEKYKTARESEIKMEDSVINILKEKMKEEVDTVKEKYDALSEADNNYIDALQEAIDKQRKLREQENKYEDLATKQKKLSLMQRDTSGANQKDVQKLEKEIEDDRQDLLDNEIDNLIDSMKELYETQKEARDLEIEAMEEQTENMQLINEMALSIITDFQSVEDYQAWLLENDKSVEDMTATQTEQYLEDAKETFSGYARYVALTTEEIGLRTDEINQKADEVFENTNENVSNIGTTIQDLAVAASDLAIEEAKEAYDEAVKNMNETQNKIDETTEKLKTAENNAFSIHQDTMNKLVEASQSAMEETATFAVKQMMEFSGANFSNEKDVQAYAKEHNLIDKNGNYSKAYLNALSDKGYDISNMQVAKTANQGYGVYNKQDPSSTIQKTFTTKEDAQKWVSQQSNASDLYVSMVSGGKTQIGAFTDKKEYKVEYSLQDGLVDVKTFKNESDANSFFNKTQNSINKMKKEYPKAYVKKKYAKGGLVDYTGPAWVDGTPMKPESFLNADDTKRIGEAAKILANLPIFNSTSNANTSMSANVGDTSIEIHINVENIASDYDVDQMIKRVEDDITSVSKPIGTPVILRK